MGNVSADQTEKTAWLLAPSDRIGSALSCDVHRLPLRSTVKDDAQVKYRVEFTRQNEIG